MYLTSLEWEEKLVDMGALWFHDGNVARPHALLTSGKHSSGFCNCEVLMEDPQLLSWACSDLIERSAHSVFSFALDRVVGPAMGAITVAHEVAKILGILRAYVEKDVPGSTRMVFKRTQLKSSEDCLIVEDVLTTGGSIERCIAAVEQAGGDVRPEILVLINRSGLDHVGGRPIFALVSKEMPIWEPDDCPLCKEGSEAIKPKDKEAWARLNAPTCKL